MKAMTNKNQTFENTLQIAMLWCHSWEKGELSDEVLADKVGELLTTRDGIRGFFVVSLSSDCPLMDRLPDPLVVQLRAGGEEVVDLAARNLAMSTAMAIHHARKGDLERESASKRITSRCQDLLRVLDTHEVKKRLDALLKATKELGEEREDEAFLSKWGYDKDQKLAIALSINAIAESTQ